MTEQRFIERARRYCELVEGLEDSAHPDLRELAAALAELYAAALSLEHTEPVREEVAGDDPAWRRVGEGIAAVLGSKGVYWTVFDPGADEEPVAATLADDLTDVYVDLRRGFAALDDGGEDEALWEWRDSFWSHWGRHAVEALRAMHDRVVTTVD